MIYFGKEAEEKGKYTAIRKVGSKGGWLEPFGSITNYLNDPTWEVISYDNLNDIDYFPK